MKGFCGHESIDNEILPRIVFPSADPIFIVRCAIMGLQPQPDCDEF
ncbi:hypothetical protein Q31a_08620 [Aureliella helgolandensis]|uniref:Uncharacterized protein n=1 Tax=Aureliella helgolandensis TaxID=2527968 RepID=A0A518G1V0_9BACT|nr:hypothetical protein Q31a_08620 [Aureliella helgolandensis]